MSATTDRVLFGGDHEKKDRHQYKKGKEKMESTFIRYKRKKIERISFQQKRKCEREKKQL